MRDAIFDLDSESAGFFIHVLGERARRNAAYGAFEMGGNHAFCGLPSQ